MTRTRAFAGLAGLLGLGALAAGLVDAWPESVRALGTLVLVLVLPAALPGGLLPHAGDGSRRDAALRLCAGFLSWLCVLALWTTAFTVLHASFRTYAVATMWGLVVYYATAAVRAWRWVGATRAPGSGAWWWIVVACALFAAVNPPRLSVGEDGLDHVGYVRHVLSENSLDPGGVLAPVAGETRAWSDPRKGALHPVLAFTSWVASTEPAVVWRWLPVVLFPAAALALVAFNGTFVASARAWIASSALILLTFDGNPFRFAAASPHGETVAALWCWVLVAAAAGGPARLRGWQWALLGAGGVLVHLGVAWHIVVLAATIAAFGNAWQISWRARVALCGWLGAGAATGLLLRHDDLGGVSNLIHSHTQGVMYVTGRWFIASPLEILRLHGLIVLGGLACVPLLALSRRRDARRVLAAAAVPFAVSFVPWIATWLHAHGSYMAFRSLVQVPAFAAIAVAATILAAGVRARDRRALFLGVPAAALWLLAFARPVPGALARDLRARAAGEPRAQGVAMRDLSRVVARLPSDAVILSDPATSYALSARASQRFVAVYQQHGNPRDPHAMERIRSVRDALTPYFVSEAAAAACRRFAVDYVVVNGLSPAGSGDFLEVWDARMYRASRARMLSMAPAFTLVDSTAHAAVYRFDPDAGLGRGWNPITPPVVTGSPSLSPCEAAAPKDAFFVTGMALDRARALPGDTVRVTLGYRRDAPLPFALPAIMHVRFDHTVVQAAPSIPGAKQWRRAVDRRAGVTSRFRADLRPGHGVYETDLWPVGFDLCETFTVIVPRNARMGDYAVELSVEAETAVPNFHARDLWFNRDHYSGRRCASLVVVDRITGAP